MWYSFVMGRKRAFDEQAVIESMAGQFIVSGYEGTSIDDLVRASGLNRSSLYQTFGSKRGAFIAVMEQAFADPGPLSNDMALDIALVALVDISPRDQRIREVVTGFVNRLGPEAAMVLGTRMLSRAGIVVQGGRRREHQDSDIR